jgi:hypothetical protein
VTLSTPLSYAPHSWLSGTEMKINIISISRSRFEPQISLQLRDTNGTLQSALYSVILEMVMGPLHIR